MFDATNDAPSASASTSPDRADLIAAHAARREAEARLAAAREAASRGEEHLAQHETTVTRHRTAQRQHTADRAGESARWERGGEGALMRGAGGDCERPGYKGLVEWRGRIVHRFDSLSRASL